jgi:hypothetical protein
MKFRSRGEADMEPNIVPKLAIGSEAYEINGQQRFQEDANDAEYVNGLDLTAVK